MRKKKKRDLVVDEGSRIVTVPLADELWSGRFMGTRIHHFSLRVERPKSVPEQILWIVHLLDLDETRPIVPE